MKLQRTASEERELRRLAGLAVIALAGVLLGGLLWPRVHAVARADSTAQNSLIASASSRVSADRLVFVAIDSPSLQLDGLWPDEIEADPTLQKIAASRWPWPRSIFADALDQLVNAGAAVVVLDVLFVSETPDDAALRASLDRNRGKVVLGADYYFERSTQGSLEPGVNMPATTLIEEPSSDPRVGLVNFWPELGVVRSAVWRTPLAARAGLETLPGATIYQSLSTAALTAIDESLKIPPGWDPVAFIFPDPGSIRTVPFYSLFVKKDWEKTLENGAIFRDKIVIIGPSATHMQDFHPTPVADHLPGPLVHASAIAAALSGGIYRNANGFENLASLVLAALVAFAITAKMRRPVVALLLLALAALAQLGLILVLFWQADLLFSVLLPMFTTASVGVTGLAWNFAIARREGVRLRSMLDRYVSRNVVKEVLDNRDDFLTSLGGTRKPMTVLFSDVRGFTTFSEEADAVAVVTQLNEYFAVMVDVVFRHGGTLDKFMGDGLMAVWGNVVSEGVDVDAHKAVRAAIEMQEQIAILNQSWAGRGFPPFAIGIGLHHGEAIFGNIGSDQKMEPTVIGDAVNLASRVEGLTKRYGCAICMSGSTAELVRNTVSIRSVDLVLVVGKSRAVEIYTVMSSAPEDPSGWLDSYEQAVALYRKGDFGAAQEAFHRCEAMRPDDTLIHLYLDRLKNLRECPPDEDWSPAVHLDKK